MSKYRVQDTMLADKVRNSPCIVTGTPPPSDCHHVKSKGSFGADVAWNLCPLTRELHQEFHKIGIETFANKYEKFKNWLLANGWTFESGKWRHFETHQTTNNI